MNNNPHLVFFTPGFPENEQDSLCIPALQIFIKAFAPRFPGKISIITFQYPYQKNHYRWHGIDVYALGGKNRRFNKFWIWHQAKKICKKINQQQPVTRLHSFWMGECAMVAADLSRKYRLPHICTLMGQDVLPKNAWFKKIKNLPMLISLSAFHARQLQTNHHLSSTIIPWGIAIKDTPVIRKKIDLIGIGSLIPLKRFDGFIEMVGRLKTFNPDINCKIIGAGILKDRLAAQIKNKGLTKNITLMGALPYAESQRLIAQSKVLLHLSDFESFGMVVIEALALQTRVITRPVGIANEIAAVQKTNSKEETLTLLRKALKENELPSPVYYDIENTVSKYLEMFAAEKKNHS